jgi:hypothetical protein
MLSNECDPSPLQSCKQHLLIILACILAYKPPFHLAQDRDVEKQCTTHISNAINRPETRQHIVVCFFVLFFGENGKIFTRGFFID